MRLIDADALESVDFSECMDSMEIMAVIDAQPTAYDPDKVTEQLEEFRPEMEQLGCGGILTDIIEVVKGGGVNE